MRISKIYTQKKKGREIAPSPSAALQQLNHFQRVVQRVGFPAKPIVKTDEIPPDVAVGGDDGKTFQVNHNMYLLVFQVFPVSIEYYNGDRMSTGFRKNQK